MNTKNAVEVSADAGSVDGLFGDIPLIVAMIGWNTQRDTLDGSPGKVVIIPWPDRGACRRLGVVNTIVPDGPGVSEKDRLLRLFVESWYIVCRDGVAIQDLHNALMVIPEYRETWNGEVLFSFPNDRDELPPLASGEAPAREADQQETCQKSRRDGGSLDRSVRNFIRETQPPV